MDSKRHSDAVVLNDKLYYKKSTIVPSMNSRNGSESVSGMAYFDDHGGRNSRIAGTITKESMDKEF